MLRHLNKQVKVNLPKVSVIQHQRHFSVRQMLTFVIVFGAIGSYLLWHSFAATQAVASQQAEQMILPASAVVYSDASASTGKAVKFNSNSTATGSVTIPSAASASSVTVRAHGNSCHGWAALSLTVDGHAVLANVSASSSTWAGYSATVSLASGTHSLGLSAGNIGHKGNCNRYLYADVTTLYGSTTVAAPTIALSASPTSVTAGTGSTLTWTTTNASSCSASGAWSGSEPTSGLASTGSLTSSQTYTLSCTGSGGTTTVSVTVTAQSSGSAGSGVPMDGNVALALTNPGTPFAPTSFWNTLLPASTPVNPNNGAYINDIQYDLQNYYGTPQQPSNGSPNTSSYSSPLYVVPANQPYVPVKPYCSNGTKVYQNYVDNVLAGGVPIPADAHAAAGTDEDIQIYQPSTNKYWDFWRLQKDSNGNWEACWGGVINNVSQSNGIFPGTFGTSATGLPLVGSVVRIEELQAGHIDHVMDLDLVNRLNPNTIPANTPGATAGFSWPAQRSDGNSTNPLAIPEGLRFRLPLNLDLSKYDLSPVAKTIAVAAQKYGFVVRDGAGSVAIDLGDPTTYTNTPSPNLHNPYTTGPGVGGIGTTGLFEGTPPYLVMKNFPWSQLQALPFNYGQL